MNRSIYNRAALATLIIISLLGGSGTAVGADESALNQLLQDKRTLEKQHGVKSLECFPFIKDIGFTEDQIPLLKNCLTGTRNLKEALAQVPNANIRTVGISTRFLRTGGFHTLLVPWDASTGNIVEFLKKTPSSEARKSFLDKIHALKRTIAQKIKISQLYCSLEISNEQCLTGYENLAAVKPGDSLKKMQWREVVMSADHGPKKDPYKLALAFGSPPQEMLGHLQKDVNRIWSVRKRGYEDIQAQFSPSFKERLQLENFICGSDLSPEECQQGASNLFQASEKDVLQEKFWGRVTIDRFNTIIKDDFHVTLRYDLPPAEVVKHFSQKASRKEATKNTIMAEKLEGRTKNNHAGLRGVCDLEDLRSELCAKAFQNFIDFLKKNRDYRVGQPWTNLMFVDGTQLSRVNFALNSSSRDTYIYMDANTNLKEMQDYLMRFKARESDG
jgi:hypothetical protein